MVDSIDQALQNYINGTNNYSQQQFGALSGGGAAPGTLTPLGLQSTASADALLASQLSANQQALQAQNASQAADLAAQQQQALSTEQYQLSQLQPKLLDLASARDFQNANIMTSAPFQRAGLEDRLGGRGLLQSGIAAGSVNRLNTGLGTRIATNDFNTQQQQDAINRQITALQAQAQATTAGLAARQQALAPAAGAAATRTPNTPPQGGSV